MGLTGEQSKERDRVAQEITTFRSEGKEDYVFISYKSDDWEKVLGKIVKHMVDTYGLRVYFDKNFKRDNDSWVSNMTDAIRTGKCRAVLAFVSKQYMVSYACLMELLTARGNATYMTHKQEADRLPIIPIIVDGSSTLDDAMSSSGEMVTMTDAEWRCYGKLLEDALKCPWVIKSDSNRLEDQITFLQSVERKRVTEELISQSSREMFGDDAYVRSFDDDASFYSYLYETIEKCSRKVFDSALIRESDKPSHSVPAKTEVEKPQGEAPSVPVSPVPMSVNNSARNRDPIDIKAKKPDTLLEYWEGFCEYTDRNGIDPAMKVSKAADRNWHAIRLGSAIIRIECTASFSKNQLRTAYYVQEAPEVFAKAQQVREIIDEALECLGNCVWDGLSKAANVSVYTSLTDKSTEEQYAWFCKAAKVMNETIRPYLGL